MVLFRELDHYFSEPVVARRALFVARAAREEIGDIDSAASRERLSREKQASRDPFNLRPNHNPDTMATEDAWTSIQLLKLLLLYREKTASPPHLFTLHQLVEHQVNSGGECCVLLLLRSSSQPFPALASKYPVVMLPARCLLGKTYHATRRRRRLAQSRVDPSSDRQRVPCCRWFGHVAGLSPWRWQGWFTLQPSAQAWIASLSPV